MIQRHTSFVLFVCLAGLCSAQQLVTVKQGKTYPVTIKTASEYLNVLSPEEEDRFMEKAAYLIETRGNGKMGGGGSVANEREKALYPTSMFFILAGREAEGVKNLTMPQRYDPKEHHAYSGGFDFWYGFTLKGQARKYFHFGHLLPRDYVKRFEAAMDTWTRTDPRNTPHPHYKKYNPQKQGWSPERFGNRQVDGRRTDNLYAMTNVTTYLFAEASGNESTRLAAWDRIRDYGVTMYMNGIGEWDSENYLSHTMSAYINLYDFAEDPTVKMHAKGMLDWISMAMAVKYWRGGWAGASKRDYGNIMVLKGNTLKAAHLYFDDVDLPCEGDRDDVHHITSAYRPPMAVIELAQGKIDKPVELLMSRPTYEYWKTDSAGRSGRDYPDFHETFYIGHTYRFGSLIDGNGGDVSGFAMISGNSQRGVDYLKIGHALTKDIKKAKDKGKTITRSKYVTTDAGNTNIAQYKNLAIYATDKGDAPFYLLTAPNALKSSQNGWVFLQHEKTWIALRPFGMDGFRKDADLSQVFSKAGDMLVGKGTGGAHAGFAMEIGEPQTHGDFETFKRTVMRSAKLSKQAEGQWTYQSSTGTSVGLKHSNGPIPGMYVNKKDQPWILERIRSEQETYEAHPTVWRNGKEHIWRDHFAQYRNPDDPSAGPVDLGFKEGVLRVRSKNYAFEGTMKEDGSYSFRNISL